ncbi:homeobox-domain-containing protein [Athelia psychrophila]|uniref:Homeobox-domain-containing protein n=1 Tax=Athelia psychrophila TaxID=1759441 RepID=A0A165Y9S9_9AGAM|nr:homeobox-domain-containing protein [Fibularhizoctonia sp. CBS 109695]
MHRYDSEEMDEGRSSMSGSSIGEPDHDAEPGSQLAEQPGPTNYEFAVPKKKRTRTLTTPRQATALHALMAQTPFPTTAMREEVGEQIGLTARKVQIWFQNQRQKSKRPVNNAATMNRSSATPGPAGAAAASPAPPVGSLSDYHGSHRLSEHPWAIGQRRRGIDGRFLPPDEVPHSASGAFWLAGPGVPGSKDSSDSGPSSPEAGAPLLYVYPQTSRSEATRHQPTTSPRRHSQSPPHARNQRALMPPMRHSGSDRDWRTLPPLNFGPHGSPTSYTRSATNLPSIGRPDSPFAYHAPYPLQPASRPADAYWSSPRAASTYDAPAERRLQAISNERSTTLAILSYNGEEPRNDEMPRPGSMSRRFDPVHDSVISNQARGYSSGSPGVQEDFNMQ